MVFDQDSVPAPNCLETLVEAYEQISERKDYNIGIVLLLPLIQGLTKL